MPEQIYKEFERKRAEVLKQPEIKEKEITKEKEKEILKKTVSEHIEKAQPLPPAQQKTALRTAQQIKAQPKEKQIQLLTDLVFEKGISHAVEVARRLQNPYLLDEFHDALVGELYSKLVEAGKLKQL
jgi:hypothetical protein